MTMHPDDITVAARSMTEAEPPHDLERRIKRRLDEVTADTGVWRPPYWLVPAGVAAALIAVLLVPKFQNPDVPVVLDVPQSTSAAVLEPPTDLSPEVVPDVPVSEAHVVRVSADQPEISEAELAWMARRIPALDPIEAMTVDQMVFDSIQPEPLVITPLTMTPLVLSPIHGDPDTTGRD